MLLLQPASRLVLCCSCCRLHYAASQQAAVEGDCHQCMDPSSPLSTAAAYPCLQPGLTFRLACPPAPQPAARHIGMQLFLLWWWRQLPILPPSPCTHRAAPPQDAKGVDHIVVYAGRTKKGELLNDAWDVALHWPTATWRCITPQQPGAEGVPTGRRGHSAVLVSEPGAVEPHMVSCIRSEGWRCWVSPGCAGSRLAVLV